MFFSSPEPPLWLSDSPSLLFNEWWGFFSGGWCWTPTTIRGVSEIFGQPVAVSSVDQNREQVHISICPPPVFEVQPHVRLTSVCGTRKQRYCIHVQLKMKRCFTYAFFTLVSPFASTPGLWNGTTGRDQTCPRVPLLRWRTFWAFIVNYCLLLFFFALQPIVVVFSQPGSGL